jgi:hypothetical protein
MNPTTISLAIVTPLSLRGVLVVTVETKPAMSLPSPGGGVDGAAPAQIAGQACWNWLSGLTHRDGAPCGPLSRGASLAPVKSKKNPKKSKNLDKLEFKKRFGSESKNTQGENQNGFDRKRID